MDTTIGELTVRAEGEVDIRWPMVPPTPVWTDQIGRYLALSDGYACRTTEDLERGKALRGDGGKLKKDIEESFRPIKQAVDAIKQPILDAEKAYLAQVVNRLYDLDAEAGAFLREQQRLAQQEADRKRKAEMEAREKERQERADLASMFGDDEQASKIAAQPVAEPRKAAVKTGLSYARGVRVTPKRKFRIVNPGEVKRLYCMPDNMAIDAAMGSWFRAIRGEPTPEQVKAFEDLVGGINIYVE